MKYETTEKILTRREIGALTLVMILRLAYISIMAVLTVLVGKSDWEKIVVGTLAALVWISVIPFWLSLKRSRGVLLVGLIGLILDLAVYGTLPWIWYNSVGGSEILPAYIVKHPNVMALGYMLVIFHSAAGRPLYPVVATVAIASMKLFQFFYASLDPRTVFSNDYVAHMTEASISPEFFFGNLFTFVACGLSLAWIARVGRRNLRTAVGKQIESDRLSRYFSPDVQKAIIRQGDPFEEKGARRDVAVLFSDVRGFTAMSEKESPETVLEWLRDYHKAMVEIIFKYGGTLDKFLGDGILAVFGAPASHTDDADRALMAAGEMQVALKKWNEERRLRNLPLFHQGIGVHFGPATVGNVGVEERLEYTVIGDTVNVASRLQGLCKEIGQDTLVSGNLKEACRRSHSLEFAGSHGIRGREATLEVFAMDLDGR